MTAMERVREVWKVGRRGLNGDAQSAIMSRDCPELTLTFHLGQWTAGIEGTPVTAFSTEKQARAFLSWISGTWYSKDVNISKFALLRCHALNPRKLRRRQLLNISRLKEQTWRAKEQTWRAVGILPTIKLFWSRKPSRFNSSRLSWLIGWSTPPGTLACDSIMPLEEVPL